MITESQGHEAPRIADQLWRSYDGHAWCGSALKEVLDGVTAEIAARKAAGTAHSIWEIVRHVSFWTGVGRRTLEGHPYPPRLTPPADWPEVTGSWPDALVELERGQTALVELVKALPDSKLDEDVSKPKGYSYYIMLHGVAQHNLYHAAQIAILKKMTV